MGAEEGLVKGRNESRRGFRVHPASDGHVGGGGAGSLLGGGDGGEVLGIELAGVVLVELVEPSHHRSARPLHARTHRQTQTHTHTRERMHAHTHTHTHKLSLAHIYANTHCI